jgi:hypothetical protein
MLRHDAGAKKYNCLVVSYVSHSRRSRTSFSRLDLLRRHMRDFYPGFKSQGSEIVG